MIQNSDNCNSDFNCNKIALWKQIMKKENVNNQVCKTHICKRFLSKNFNKTYYTIVFLCKEILYSCCHQSRGQQQDISNLRDKNYYETVHQGLIQQHQKMSTT